MVGIRIVSGLQLTEYAHRKHTGSIELDPLIL